MLHNIPQPCPPFFTFALIHYLLQFLICNFNLWILPSVLLPPLCLCKIIYHYFSIGNYLYCFSCSWWPPHWSLPGCFWKGYWSYICCLHEFPPLRSRFSLVLGSFDPFWLDGILWPFLLLLIITSQVAQGRIVLGGCCQLGWHCTHWWWWSPWRSLYCGWRCHLTLSFHGPALACYLRSTYQSNLPRQCFSCCHLHCGRPSGEGWSLFTLCRRKSDPSQPWYSLWRSGLGEKYQYHSNGHQGQRWGGI